jgi:hypothetical protein
VCVLCECGSGSPRMRDLRGPCLCSNPPAKKNTCRGTHRAGGCLLCVVRVRERSAPKAGSARTLLV